MSSEQFLQKREADALGLPGCIDMNQSEKKTGGKVWGYQSEPCVLGNARTWIFSEGGMRSSTEKRRGECVHGQDFHFTCSDCSICTRQPLGGARRTAHVEVHKQRACGLAFRSLDCRV